MKRQHRPVRGLLLLALALFFAAGSSCGAAGKLVSHLVLRFVGLGGLVILCTTLVAIAAIYLVPPGAVARWMTRVREDRREARRERRRQLRQAVVHAPAVVAAPPVEAPQDRMMRERVRAAMKGLGYKPFEFEAFVQEMDTAQPVELLVREGLRKMQERRAVS